LGASASRLNVSTKKNQWLLTSQNSSSSVPSLVWTRPGGSDSGLKAPSESSISSKSQRKEAWPSGQGCHKVALRSENNLNGAREQPPHHRDNSAVEYLYGSVYRRSADGLKLVRSQPDSHSSSSNQAPQTTSSTTIRYGASSAGEVPKSGNGATELKRKVHSFSTKSSPGVSSSGCGDGSSNSSGSGSGGDIGDGNKEDMEAALKRARQHLAASGHIARSLAKRKAKDDQPQKLQQAKAAASKAAKEQLEAKQAKAEADAARKKKQPCSFFVRNGICANGDRCL
jgi:hypothetical protein